MQEFEFKSQGDSLGALRRIDRIDFPNFVSEDFDEWIYKVN